ncbi:SseB family protein [Micrococcus endophyticus]|uniref:SseB family protein n=1 Tax=Micrococcus endophyticus TaxID=455343 RepID=UPI003800F148
MTHGHDDGAPAGAAGAGPIEETVAVPRPDSRELPGHIRAALDRMREKTAGPNTADTAGVPWEGRDLSGSGVDGSANPLHVFDEDDGTSPEEWTRVMAALTTGAAGEAEVTDVLARIRVFAAVVPTLAVDEDDVHDHADHSGHEHDVAAQGDKAADVALVTMRAPDGRQALPVFTSVPALTAWNPIARPVAVWMPRACLSAVDEGCELVVVDAGAEHTYAVRRPAVWALAQQKPWTPSYRDQEIADEIAQVADLVPHLLNLGLAPGSGVATHTGSGAVMSGGGAGPELQIVAMPARDADAAGVRLMAATLKTLLADLPLLAERADSVEVTVRRP